MNKKKIKSKRKKKNKKKRINKKKELAKNIKKGAREVIGPVPPSKTFKDKKKYDRKKEKKATDENK